MSAYCGNAADCRAAGFTFIEILIASSMLVVALLGIAAVLPVADMTLHQSGQVSKAVSLAQEMIEMLKNDRFTDLPEYNGVDTRSTSTYPVNNPTTPTQYATTNFMGGGNVAKWANDIQLFLASGAGITGGYGTITVTQVAANPTTGSPILRKVSVRVFWTQRGHQHQVTLETLASAI